MGKERHGPQGFRLLTDAAISGDGVLYCYWDTESRGAGNFSGDIMTEVIDNVNLFVADVNRADIQSQDYIILSGRAPVSSLAAEALRAGAGEEDIKKIVADSEFDWQSGDMARYELDSDGGKATYIIRFWREDGRVVFEKSVRGCVIRRARTALRLYPVAYFNWTPTRQLSRNLSDNAAYPQPKIHKPRLCHGDEAYDRHRVSRLSTTRRKFGVVNEVGQAIAAVGGEEHRGCGVCCGSVRCRAHTLQLIDSAINVKKRALRRDRCGARQS